MNLLKGLGILWTTSPRRMERLPPDFEGEPLDHPELRGLSLRELADLPVPRH